MPTKPKMPETLQHTYMEPLNAEETEMLYRMVVLGLFGGDTSIRASVSRKVSKARENAQLGRAWLCTRDILEGQKPRRESKEKEKEKV